MLQRSETLTGGSIVDWLLTQSKVTEIRDGQETEAPDAEKFRTVVETAINDLLHEARARGMRTLDAASEQPVHNIILTDDWTTEPGEADDMAQCDCPLCRLMADMT